MQKYMAFLVTLRLPDAKTFVLNIANMHFLEDISEVLL